jgi:type II secretory ATPase GspE/PulE/Tfp pilus assembly ATPase PilB-like protein
MLIAVADFLISYIMDGIMGGTITPVETSAAQTKRGIQQIISRALKNNVTVIHIEPMAHAVVVRYRRGGTLYQATTLPKTTALALAKYFKRLAQLDINQIQAPQNGQYLHRLSRKTYVIQVSTLPVIDGEKVTLKLSSPTPAVENLQDMGLWGSSLSMVQQALTQPSGLIMVAGQPAAESNAVQLSMLHLLSRTSLKIAYLGNSDALTLPGIKTIKIHPEAGWGFNRYLTLLAGQGFEAIGLSSLLDRRTALTADNIAQSGALVILAVPTATAVRGLLYLQQATRLLSSLVLTRAVLGQLFVRSLCAHCREAYKPTIEEQKSLQKLLKINNPLCIRRYAELEKQANECGIEPEIDLSLNQGKVTKLWRAHPLGCKHCDNTGYGSRIGLFEVCLPDSALLNALATKKSLTELQSIAIKSGMISIKIDSFIKALRGVVDYSTLVSVCYRYDQLMD